MLPVVNVFNTPYKKWTTREPTLEESKAFFDKNGHYPTCWNDKLIATITNHFDAAKHIISQNGVDRELECHIDRELEKCPKFKLWRKSMPQKTPKVFYDYQQRYPNYRKDQLDIEMSKLTTTIQDNQYLFHGGMWSNPTSTLITNRVLSTSFCPQVALRNGEHKLKAFKNNCLELFIIKTNKSNTKMFAYRQKGTRMGYEKEVLFSKNAKLEITNKSLIRNDYTATDVDGNRKEIPIYITEIDLS